MNNFTIDISYNYNLKPGVDVIGHDIVKGESLVEVLSKLLITVASIQNGIEEKRKQIESEDDIPF